MRDSGWWMLIIVGLVLLTSNIQAASAQTEPPGPDMPPLPQGLDPPPTVYPPTQVSEGANVYYLVCMACHGDKGQGLTDEWRGALDPPDQNCWQSRCHATNYPPGGFVFPKIVPALASPGMLARFETALDLYLYLNDEMPFQAPGSLEDEEYWQLTAFLLSLNGLDPGSPLLTQEKARQIKLREKVIGVPAPTTAPPPGAGVWWIIIGLSGSLVFLLILTIALRRSRSGLSRGPSGEPPGG
jgi:mono/diheme cytochrome c family protein